MRSILLASLAISMSDSSVFAASDAQRTSVIPDDRGIAINAWRGIAALLVAYFHCRQVTWIGMQQFHRTVHGFDANAVISYLTFPVAWGSACVPIFFVISGYCIHRAMARKLIADPFVPLDSTNFLLRRFARIYPVLIAALLLTFALDSLSATFQPASWKINPFDLHAFLVNLLSLQGIAGKTFGSNGALWTLSIEVQFYLVYPPLIALRRRVGMRGVLVFVGIMNIGSALLFERHQIVVFTSYWFAWTLGGVDRGGQGAWRQVVAAHWPCCWLDRAHRMRRLQSRAICRVSALGRCVRGVSVRRAR